MQKSYQLLDSPSLGRKVHLWSYGHFGPPVLVFPSAAGFAHEWQAQGMIDVLAPWLEAGRLKLYCPDSNVSETWAAKSGSLRDRMARHRAYEGMILNELVPWIRRDCRTPDIRLWTMGCSLGATYAANMALKQPEIFSRALCMSGRYLATALTKGEDNEDVYFNNPLAFVPGLTGAALDRVRRQTHLTLVCGRGMWEEGCIEETIALGRLLGQKDIPNETDIWGRDSRHDWDWWQKQLRHHIGRWLG
jgi:esterase/lipase superfamily enzyme